MARTSLVAPLICLLWTGCHLVFPFELGEKTDGGSVQVLDLLGPPHDRPNPTPDGAVLHDAPPQDQQTAQADGIKPKPDLLLHADVKVPKSDLQATDTQQPPPDTQQPPPDTLPPPPDTQQPPPDTQPPPADGYSLPDIPIYKDLSVVYTCAGPTNIKCGPGEVCDVLSCIANDIGVCKPKPTVCPMVFAPVCGCNGKTYTNNCERLKAAVALDHTGPC